MDAPTDSDGLAVSRAVTAALLEHGLAASTATVAGWADPGAAIVRFFHQVTVWEGFVLAGTARQFSTALPAAWIAPVEIFLHDLAHADHADHASFSPAVTLPRFVSAAPVRQSRIAVRRSYDHRVIETMCRVAPSRGVSSRARGLA
ncbi:hypothetical protein [Nocardia gipuzkoensis]|uniref:hypothetical protein n=1 Tax=Nocardia gipuzkoensis TaxID=2749991 RepID=UPI0024538692|nr:hypothetical protein [Nocardia gipuzkoensis]